MTTKETRHKPKANREDGPYMFGGTGNRATKYTPKGRVRCGCTLDGVGVIYCPTHAAAQEMKEMLRQVVALAGEARTLLLRLTAPEETSGGCTPDAHIWNSGLFCCCGLRKREYR